MHDIRDLERAEGAALHAHASFEEVIDWSEPLGAFFYFCHVAPRVFSRTNVITALELPALDLPERGNASAEKAIQEERELTALAPLYMSDSPAELPGPQSTEELDKDVVHMLTGPEADAVFWLPAPDAGAGAVPAPLPTPAVSVSDLVGQLAGGALLQQQQQHSIAPEQIQQILAQLQPALYNQQQGQQQASVPGSSHLVGQQQTAAGFYGGNGQDEDWNQGQYPFGGGLQPPQPGGWDGGAGRGPWQGHQTGDGIGGRGRGGGGGFGRGRGRGGFNSKRIPCKFYPQGRRAPDPLSASLRDESTRADESSCAVVDEVTHASSRTRCRRSQVIEPENSGPERVPCSGISCMLFYAFFAPVHGLRSGLWFAHFIASCNLLNIGSDGLLIGC